MLHLTSESSSFSTSLSMRMLPKSQSLRRSGLFLQVLKVFLLSLHLSPLASTDFNGMPPQENWLVVEPPL
jgi:hypothetical protein